MSEKREIPRDYKDLFGDLSKNQKCNSRNEIRVPGCSSDLGMPQRWYQ